MRRVARYTLNCLTVLSLLLCVATVLLWVTSYFVGQRLYVQRLRDHSGKAYWTADPASWYEDTVEVGDGGIGFFHLVRSADPLREFPKERWQTALGQSPAYRSESPLYPRFSALSTDTRSWKGFEYGSRSHFFWLIVLPLWSLTFVSAVLPAVRAVNWARRREGKCAGCGYDMRATPAKCPECGRAAAAANAPVTGAV